MKIIVATDSPTSATGFSWQMRYIVDYLSSRGHEIDYVGWQTTIQSTYVTSKGKEITVLPVPNTGRQDDLFARRILPFYFSQKDYDVFITLGDAWMVNQVPSYPNTPLWIMYYPIDGHPLNDDIRNTVMRADYPVAMSKYGLKMVKNEGIQSDYIPHQIDYSRFVKYSSPKVKRKNRKKHFPMLKGDTVLFGSIARINPRKHHMRLLRSFDKFVRKYNLTPDDVALYLHCDVKDVMMHTRVNGHDYIFLELIDTLDLNDYVIYPNPETFTFDKGVPEQELMERMSAIDIHVSATGGEGFGVPTLETMAMGIPQVITNYTTSEELLVHKDPFTYEHTDKVRGILVPYSRLYLERPMVYKAWVDTDKMAEAFYTYYSNEDLRKEHGNNGKEFARHYDSKKINKLWGKLIDKVAEINVINY